MLKNKLALVAIISGSLFMGCEKPSELCDCRTETREYFDSFSRGIQNDSGWVGSDEPTFKCDNEDYSFGTVRNATGAGYEVRTHRRIFVNCN